MEKEKTIFKINPEIKTRLDYTIADAFIINNEYGIVVLSERDLKNGKTKKTNM